MAMRVLACVMMLWPTIAGAQADDAAAVRYAVSFDNAVHHEARIKVTYSDIGDAPLELRMSRSSPGRYALHEFAKNVYDVTAVNGAGEPLSITRDDPYSWIVAGHDGTVTATYTLYGDRAGGTYSQVDTTHAHLNMPASFMWAAGFDDRPVTVTFQPADTDWKAATQLEPTDTAMTFRAPNLQYFMDSPTELSDFDLREWTVDEDGKTYTFRLAIHHDGSEEDADTFAEMAKNVVAQDIALWGDVPDFDYGTYTFIAGYLPYVSGDGMEHRNSTIITRSQSLQDGEFKQLGTLSHEFFHAWNVERLRPAELEPFDFTRANPTPSLWFAEGFTNYYGPLQRLRAGELSLADYLEGTGGTLGYILNSPGRAHDSPQGMSLHAPFVDAATAIDPTNFANTFTSYYPYGQIIGMALDLTLRQRFDAVTLDDYMRQMWETHGKTEIPYMPDDLKTGLAEVTGDKAFADEFFAQYIEAGGLPDFAPLLAQAGLELRKAKAGEAWAGPVDFDVAENAVTLDGATIAGTPLYEAGLDRDDEIIALDGVDIDSEEDWNDAISGQKPGDSVEIRFTRRGAEQSAELVLAEDPSLEIVTFEDADRAVSAEQMAFRGAWLGDHLE